MFLYFTGVGLFYGRKCKNVIEDIKDLNEEVIDTSFQEGLESFLDSDRVEKPPFLKKYDPDPEQKEDSTRNNIKSIKQLHAQSLFAFLKDSRHELQLDEKNYLSQDSYSQVGINKEFISVLTSLVYLLGIAFSFMSIAYALILNDSDAGEKIIEVVGSKFVVSVVGIILFIMLQYYFGSLFSKIDSGVASLRFDLNNVLIKSIKSHNADRYQKLGTFEALRNNIFDLEAEMFRMNSGANGISIKLQSILNSLAKAYEQNYKGIKKANEVDTRLVKLEETMFNAEKTLTASKECFRETMQQAYESQIQSVEIFKRFEITLAKLDESVNGTNVYLSSLVKESEGESEGTQQD